MVISIILTILILVGNWMVYRKMGREGWEAIIPCYNSYVLFDALYGNGWKFLLLLIPFYNIYVGIKLNIDLAHAFNQKTGFGIGLILLPFVFLLILAFGDAQFRDGTQANTKDDFVAKAVDSITAPGRVCPNCGRHLESGADFCSACGTKYVEPKKKICPNCGNVLNEGDDFCMKCGTKYYEKVVKTCPGCGAEVTDDQVFCAVCGTRIGDVAEEVVVEEPAPTCKVCPSCGAENSLDSLFCFSCGQKLD